MTRIRLAFFLLLVWLAPGHAAAANPPPACGGKDFVAELRRNAPLYGELLDALLDWQAARVPNGKGMLWRIDRSGLPPSYIIGTMHMSDQRLLELVPKLQPYLGPGHVLATELGEALIGTEKYVLAGKLMLRSLVPTGNSLAVVADPADRQAVEALLARRGLKGDAVNRMALWLLAMSVSIPPCELVRQQAGLLSLDDSLTQAAKASGTRVVGLETADEQIDLITAIPPDLSARLLVAAARSKRRPEDAFATFTGLYLDGRSGIVLSPLLPTWLLGSAAADNQRLARVLIANRNQTMVGRAMPLLDKGNVLIAVGAAHLPGDNGLIELIRRSGFTVSRVW